MNANQEIAAEMKSLLKKFNKGVDEVTIEEGIICVYVNTIRAVHGVKLDLLRCGGFRSVLHTENNVDGGFIIHAVPARLDNTVF